MGQDSRLDSGHFGKPVSHSIVGSYTLLTGLAAALWFFSSAPSGVAFGLWQGPLLDGDWMHPLPVLARGAARLSELLAPGNSLAALNLATCAAAAIACAMLAAIVVQTAERFTERPVALMAGLLAAGAFAVSPPLLEVSLGAHPAPFSVAFALAAVFCLLRAADSARPGRWDAAAGAAAGLAAANLPSLLLLGLLLLFALLLMPDRGARPMARRFLCFLLPFALCALLPVALAAARGESLRQFLQHALAAPYPALFEAPPELGFGRSLLELLPGRILLFAVPGLTVLLIPRARAGAWLAAAALCVMGPLLPALTNQYAGASVLVDDSAPTLLVLAAVCAFIGWGGALLANAAFRPLRGARVRAVVAGACLAGILAALWPALPNPGHARARALGHELLGACPENGVLVSGSPHLTSLLLATQRAEGLRRDVSVLPAAGLAEPAARARLAERLPSQFNLPTDFPSGRDIQTWERTLPIDFLALAQTTDEKQRDHLLGELALWNLVAENRPRWPLCFAGCSPDWLVARAEVHAGMLWYPDAEPVAAPFDLDTLIPGYAPLGPDARTTLAALLLPLARTALAQDRRAEAAVLAGLGGALLPGHPGFALLSVRVPAHEGDIDAVTARLDALLAQRRAIDIPDLEPVVSADLREHTQRTDFIEHIEAECAGAPDVDARQAFAEPLWHARDFVPLIEGYRRLLEAHPEDMDALYQLAAAYAELGQWKQVEAHIGQWMAQGEQALGDALEQLYRDGRFSLFLHRQAAAAETGAGIL